MPHPPDPRSAYLHIPFCHRRCFYCDFVVVPLGGSGRCGLRARQRASITAYLNQLQREIAAAPNGAPLATIYIGGGTPLPLTSDQIGALIDALRHRYGIQQGAEITLEMDPASFDQRKLQQIIGCGVNRISLGGQSFDDEVLDRPGRRHRRQDLLEACAWMQVAYGMVSSAPEPGSDPEPPRSDCGFVGSPTGAGSPAMPLIFGFMTYPWNLNGVSAAATAGPVGSAG